MSTLIQRKTAEKYENAAAESISSHSISSDTSKSNKFKDTPPPQLRSHKVFVRIVLASAIFTVVYFTANKEKNVTLAGYRELVSLREHKLICTPNSFTQEEIEKFPKCISICKRLVTDNLFNENEIMQLKMFEEKIFENKDESSRIYNLNSHSTALSELTKALHDTIKSIQPKIIENIAQRFEISHKILYLTKPTYFAQITNVTNEYSEPFHSHNFDKEAHKHVHYTVIIFLSTYKRDHQSGRFIFVDVEKKKMKHSIIDPKLGRTVIYSSGDENTHVFENLISGHLSFLTLSFTCDNEAVLLLK
ncbi:hypothetical protein PVAND_004340 [Polypedilum vanderplanki]|uniref:Prolyl 4-hydroxylase alpha subunit domain-containing protein n=1 Tax=Polypedilum vanderplanki TaxID=319348 RepID=A0A9J6BYU8_POLVA|nr:hypothetical protein PVAND_004340 [Polypedilum vanderplanki]